MSRTWSIFIIYEDSATRKLATEVCDELVKRRWSELELEVAWSSCPKLEDSRHADQAVERAARADCLILALKPEGALAEVTKLWLEDILKRRGKREGTLIDLLHKDEVFADIEKHCYLRHLAHRGGMDYLTTPPETISRGMPDSLDSYAARAEQVTSVLDEILHAHKAPAHLLSLGKTR